MPDIVPALWCDHTADEAAEFYTHIFPDSSITSTFRYPHEGLLDFQQKFAGRTLTVDLVLWGQPFVLINAGPSFRPNAALSFMVNVDPSRDDDAEATLDALWSDLAEGGEIRMNLGEYPFSRRYGWVEDRFGVNWQLILTDPDGEPRPPIIPTFLFGGPAQGRATEAREFWTGLFPHSRTGAFVPYAGQAGPATPGSTMFSDFALDNQWFVAMDAAAGDTAFSEGVSLMVMCDDQAEIDHYWDALSAVPEAEQCGWCKDQFGVSWQVVPAQVNELLSRPGAFANMLQMKKLVIDDY